MSLSGNIPDPSFPPVPDQKWPAANVYVAGPSFADLGHSQPLENQPITLEPTAHVTTVVPLGGDPLTEDPTKADSPPSDQTLTETSRGADYS